MCLFQAAVVIISIFNLIHLENDYKNNQTGNNISRILISFDSKKLETPIALRKIDKLLQNDWKLLNDKFVSNEIFDQEKNINLKETLNSVGNSRLQFSLLESLPSLPQLPPLPQITPDPDTSIRINIAVIVLCGINFLCIILTLALGKIFFNSY